MAGFVILLALLLGGAAFLFKEASDEIAVGSGWAGDVCSASKLFCQHPEYIAYAGGILLVLAIGFKIGSVGK